MKLVAFVLNLPWTVLGILLSIISIPTKLSFNQKPAAFVFNIKSFWWYSWLPGTKGIRGMAIGNVVLLGKILDKRDIAHELVHVEQSEREPFVHWFLYEFESLRKGYRNNKYEIEAYERAGNVYLVKN